MNIKLQILFIALALALLGSGQLLAASFSGKLVKAIDGDVIEVEVDGRVEAVRLAQIYAPLEDQPYGVSARNFVSKVAASKRVAVRFDARDHYGRVVGEVFLPDGTNLNKLLVGSGYAWRYTGFSDDPAYAELQAKARAKGLGLWGVDNPVPPWEWRWVRSQATVMRAAAEQSAGAGSVCGSKQYCREMESCEEAKFYLYACGLSRLDRDGNGVPCEMLCRP